MNRISLPAEVNLDIYAEEIANPDSKFGLPRNVVYCKKCVISNQRPNSAIEYNHTQESKKATINFDAFGVCDACSFAERKQSQIDWAERDKELRELCDKYRKNDG